MMIGSKDSKICGGCACGAIRYESKVDAKFSIICQCRQCQRITGSGHAASFAVPAESARVEGKITYYDQIADSGSTVSSGFCGTCGSPVLKKTTKVPQLLFFHAATLDDPSTFKPEMVVYESSKQPWDHVDPNIPRK